MIQAALESPARSVSRASVEKVVLAFDQEAEHLALADEDAEAAQQRHQSRHCHLPLMVLGEHEAAQLRPEVTIDTVRQRRRHRAAIRHLPALAAEIHDMPTDHQILHHEARVAFEAGPPRRRRHFDGPLRVDRKLRPRAASRAFPIAGASRRLRLGPPLHAARFDVRPTRPTLQPCNLIAQRRHHSLQLNDLLPLLDNQAFQLGMRQAVKIVRRRHPQRESDSRSPVNRKIIPLPRLLPLLQDLGIRGKFPGGGVKQPKV